MNSDVTVHIGSQKIEYVEPLRDESDWIGTLAETGALKPTGGRLVRAKRFLDGGTFLATYGDGLSNVYLSKLLAFHRAKGKVATITGVRPVTRFGELAVSAGIARESREKPQLDEGWVKDGFFVFEPKIFDYLTDDATLEREPLDRLTRDGQLAVHEHAGYWAAMDTFCETQLLNEEWASGTPGWLEP